MCNESSLTGESKEVKKTKHTDCFLLSSCLVTDGDEARAMVIAVGLSSQWGKIKVNLVTKVVNTPLQDKLEVLSTKVKIFLFFSLALYFYFSFFIVS